MSGMDPTNQHRRRDWISASACLTEGSSRGPVMARSAGNPQGKHRAALLFGSFILGKQNKRTRALVRKTKLNRSGLLTSFALRASLAYGCSTRFALLSSIRWNDWTGVKPDQNLKTRPVIAEIAKRLSAMHNHPVFLIPAEIALIVRNSGSSQRSRSFSSTEVSR